MNLQPVKYFAENIEDGLWGLGHEVSIRIYLFRGNFGSNKKMRPNANSTIFIELTVIGHHMPNKF